MAELALSNILNVSVSAAPVGAGRYNTSNIGMFTHEIPGDDFGDDGYKIYKAPSEVLTDFGTSSVTGALANAIFSQKPNILAGSGYLVVMPYVDTPEVQHLAFSGTPATGSYKLNYGAEITGLIVATSNAATVQSALRLLDGLENVTVSGSEAAGFDVTFVGVPGDATALTVSNNTLMTSAPASVTITVTTPTPGVAETLGEAITRTESLVQYFGIVDTEISGSVELLAAAAIVQPLNKILFAPSKTSADVNSGGLIDLLRTGSFTQTRGLLYIGTGVTLDALVYAASYAGRALSTDFTGSRTTQTMHLKDLIGVQPDAGVTQTILEKAKTAGADLYVNLQGIPKVFCTQGNTFFDRVYNLQWFVGAIQVAGFNALATTSTKVAQTEEGIGILKAAYRSVCEQAAGNQYIAPGTWNSSDTFGNLSDFLDNVSQRGYYIFSASIANQSQVDREARIAPLVQIAVKEAGAIQSGNVLIFVNA